jgi:HPt (histidine-containing phosphotransfer) domain-containing protein
MMNDDALVDVVTAGFLDDMPGQLARLGSDLASGDAPSARRLAHTIRGAAANIGGERLSDVAAEVERAVASGDVQAARPLMLVLDHEFQQLRDAMRAHEWSAPEGLLTRS